MHVGNDCRYGKTPLEAHRQVQHDADDHQQQRHGAVRGELLAHLRADELHAAQLGLLPRLCLQRLHHLLRNLRGVQALAVRQADQHVARAAEVLHLCVRVAIGGQPLADRLKLRRLGVAHFHQRAAGEFHRKMQAACGKEEHRQHEGDQRDDVEHQRVAHEGDVLLDAEEFHDYFSCRLKCLFARFPDLPDRQCVDLAAAAVDEVDQHA